MDTKAQSWLELVDEVARINPELADMVMRLSEAIEMNIYGLYLRGDVQPHELKEFYMQLDEWRRLSLEMFRLLGEGGDHA